MREPPRWEAERVGMDNIYGNWVRPLQGNSWEVKADSEEREPCEEECWARRGPRELLDPALWRNLVGGRFYGTVLTISEDFRNYFQIWRKCPEVQLYFQRSVLTTAGGVVTRDGIRESLWVGGVNRGVREQGREKEDSRRGLGPWGFHFMLLEMLFTGNPQGGQVLGSIWEAWWSSQVLWGSWRTLSRLCVQGESGSRSLLWKPEEKTSHFCLCCLCEQACVGSQSSHFRSSP